MKKSKLLLVAAILSSLYAIYIVCYFFGTTASSQGMEALGAGLATAIVMPHMVCVCVAVIFNWLGWAMKARWAALVAGILYAVAIVCFFLYGLFVALQMILCFVAFAKMKEKSQQVAQNINEVNEETL